MKSERTPVHGIHIFEIGSYVLSNHQHDPYEYIGRVTQIYYSEKGGAYKPVTTTQLGTISAKELIHFIRERQLYYHVSYEGMPNEILPFERVLPIEYLAEGSCVYIKLQNSFDTQTLATFMGYDEATHTCRIRHEGHGYYKLPLGSIRTKILYTAKLKERKPLFYETDTSLDAPKLALSSQIFKKGDMVMSNYQEDEFEYVGIITAIFYTEFGMPVVETPYEDIEKMNQLDPISLDKLIKENRLLYLVSYFGLPAELIPFERVLEVRIIESTMVYYKEKKGRFSKLPTAKVIKIQADGLLVDLGEKQNKLIDFEQIRTEITHESKFKHEANIPPTPDTPPARTISSEKGGKK